MLQLCIYGTRRAQALRRFDPRQRQREQDRRESKREDGREVEDRWGLAACQEHRLRRGFRVG